MCRRSMWIGTLLVLCAAALPAWGGLEDGLVAHFKLDEGSGTVAADASGNGNDGTVIGTLLEWVPGYDNGSLLIAAPETVEVSDRLEFPTTGMSPATGTVATWAYLTDPQPGTSGRYLFGHSSAPTGRSFADRLQIYLQDPTPPLPQRYSRKLDIGLGSSHTTKLDIVELPLEEWVHVALTWNNGVYVVYVNGEPVDNGSYTGLTTFRSVANFGNDGCGDPYEAFCGMLDEERVYNRAITAAEVKEIVQLPHVSPIRAWGPRPVDGAKDVTAPLFTWKSLSTIRLHNIYLGTTPDLTEANLVAARQPINMYFHAPMLEPGVTYYWRVDGIDADMVTIHTGVVWSFMAQPVTAYEPGPADGINTAPLTTTLKWLAGTGALKHHVYFGDDRDAVTQGAAGVDKGIFQDPNFSPGELQSATTYYWRIDEIGVGDVVKTGGVWSFTTVVPVDDFESYTDAEGSRIYESWIDGWTNGTGSTVGNTQAPFAEQTIVHGGKQSMPLDYNNVNSPFYSEAELTFATKQNWTADGTDTLVIYVRGALANKAAPVYVMLKDASNRTAVVAHPDAKVVTTLTWTEWKIPLDSFTGVSVNAVKVLYVGVGDRASPAAGSTGRIYVDDIGLAASFQLSYLVRLEPAVYLNQVLLLMLELGVRKPVGKLAVVGQKQKPGAVFIQTPHGIQPQLAIFLRQNVQNRPATLLIAGSGYDTHRLVDHQINRAPWLEVNRFAIQRDAVSLQIHRMAEVFHRLAIYFHPAILYDISHPPPGANSGFSQSFK